MIDPFAAAPAGIDPFAASAGGTATPAPVAAPPMPADPFAAPAAAPTVIGGADPFGLATTAFVGIPEMVGRLVLVHPLRSTQEKSNTKPGEFYTAIFCNVVVMSGQPTDTIPDVPGQYDDVMISSGMCVRQLTPYLARAERFLFLGVVSAQPSRANKQVNAYAFSEPTEQMIAYARPHAQRYMAEWQARQAKVQPADPFGV
jgi:hypothetical protein